MHLNGKVLGLNFLPALTDSVSSFNEWIRHDSSLYVSGFLFFVDEVDLPRFFLKVLDHDFLFFWLIDIIGPGLGKLIVSWISDILLFLILFGFFHRKWLMLFEVHWLGPFWLILHALIEILIKSKSATKALGVIEIVYSRADTWLIIFAPPRGIGHRIALLLVIDALMQSNDGLLQRLVGQFVAKSNNSLEEVVYCRRSFGSVGGCGNNRLHRSIVEVRMVFVDVPVSLRFPRKDLVLIMRIMLIFDLSLPLIITIINRLFNLHLSSAGLASLCLHNNSHKAEESHLKLSLHFYMNWGVTKMMNNTTGLSIIWSHRDFCLAWTLTLLSYSALAPSTWSFRSNVSWRSSFLVAWTLATSPPLSFQLPSAAWIRSCRSFPSKEWSYSYCWP